jgi:hypothetical protein
VGVEVALSAQTGIPPDLDPSLPELHRALDQVDAARQFARIWLGPRHASSISECVLEYLRWSPGECVATYRLTAEPACANPAVTLGFVTVDPDGLHHRLFTADEGLPGLAAATDPSVMRGWFAECLARPVHSCSITPVRYRPGRRCVLRYELSDSDDRTVLYGKVLGGDQSSQLAATIASLGESLVAPLVGTAPEWQLVVQADAGERSLGATGASASRSELADFQAGGGLLARLHSRSTPPGRHQSLAEDADELHQYLPACERLAPQTAALLVEGIGLISARTDHVGPAVPTHGAFRFDQVHLAARPMLIDLDSFCWADPARDIGNLLAYLRWREIRRPALAVALQEVRRAFLVGYASEAAAPLDSERVRAFEGTSLLKIAGRRYPRLKVEQWERVPELIDAAFERLGADAARTS